MRLSGHILDSCGTTARRVVPTDFLRRVERLVWPWNCSRATETLKGVLEGIVYALLIRVGQREFVDVEKVPAEKGPPRKVFSLNAAGRAHLDKFRRTWSFLAERLEQLRKGDS